MGHPPSPTSSRSCFKNYTLNSKYTCTSTCTDMHTQAWTSGWGGAGDETEGPWGRAAFRNGGVGPDPCPLCTQLWPLVCLVLFEHECPRAETGG